MKILKTIAPAIIIGFLCLAFPDPAHAAGSFGQGITNAVTFATGAGALSSLTLYNIMLNIINFFVSLTGALSILGIVIGGTLYVISAGNEQKSAQAKRIISFSMLGLMIVLARLLFLSIVFVWLGLPIPINFTPPGGMSFSSIILAIIAFINGLIAIISVLLIIIGGFMYVTSTGDDQKTAKAKKTIFAALAGLLIVMIAGTIVPIIQNIITIGAMPGDILAIGSIIFNIIAFILAFTSIVAVAAFIYGAFTYITSGGQEEKAQRGKKIIIYAVIGIVVIMASGAIVNVVVGPS